MKRSLVSFLFIAVVEDPNKMLAIEQNIEYADIFVSTPIVLGIRERLSSLAVATSASTAAGSL